MPTIARIGSDGRPKPNVVILRPATEKDKWWAVAENVIGFGVTRGDAIKDLTGKLQARGPHEPKVSEPVLSAIGRRKVAKRYDWQADDPLSKEQA